ncbi:MAG: CapA family protein [Chloroflexi bacterium]|nr:CapA family protein [Chloroflexota bacterium]
MQKEFTLAMTGECIINRRIYVDTDERFLALIKVVRDADIGFTHLESVIHDYEGPEIYPCAEPGWTWMRSPRFVPDELKWAGFDIVSHAGNHALDYSYGGLYSTWKALDEAGLPHAGTGRNLGDARAPAYLETPKGRVALISMTTSFSGWARAGDTRSNANGRPGVNPLRFYYVCDAKTMELIKQLFTQLSLLLRQQGNLVTSSPPGNNLAITRFVEGDQPGVTTVADEDDAEGNLRAIKDARRQADWVIAHLHNHWLSYDPVKGHSSAIQFVQSFGRSCIDAGADVFIEEGAGNLLRGVEVYRSKPIFYNPGRFLGMGHTVTRLPADFYQWPSFPPEVKGPKATPADGYDARLKLWETSKPVGLEHAPVSDSIIGICSYAEDRRLTGIKIYPIMHIWEPRSRSGMPRLVDADRAKKMVEYLNKVSAPYGTRIEFKDGIGVISL